MEEVSRQAKNGVSGNGIHFIEGWREGGGAIELKKTKSVYIFNT